MRPGSPISVSLRIRYRNRPIGVKFGFPISLIMHLGFVFGGVLIWNSSTSPLQDVRIIPLELVTVSDITNIKPTQKKPDPVEPEELEPESEDPTEEVVPEEAELVPEEAEPVAEDVPTESPDGELLADETPDEVPNVEPEPQSMDDFLNSFSQSVDQARKDNPDANRQAVLGSEIADRTVQGVGDQSGYTVNPTEYIQSKMLNCYKVDTGAQDYRNLRVEVRVNLSREGDIKDIKVLNEMQILASPNNSWRAARDNVVFALNECAPYDKLPKADYNNWKTTKLNFQPTDES